MLWHSRLSHPLAGPQEKSDVMEKEMRERTEGDSAGKMWRREVLGVHRELNLAPEDQCLLGEVGCCPLK